MDRLREHISPALVLSIVAVFIALGGGAYAAVQANSVGTKQLKKNAVTAQKIRNNAVVAAKIKAGSINDSKIVAGGLTGAKINESSLGQVPSALKAVKAGSADKSDSSTKAGSAARLDGYQRLGLKRLQSTASNPSFNAAQAAATEVPLFQLGSITIYAKCFKVTSSLYAALYLKTSVNGALFDAQYDSAFGSPSFLDTGTPEADREIYYVSTGTDSYSYYTNADPTYVLTADGKSYRATTQSYVKQGTLPGGNGPYGAGDNCVFAGDAGLN